MDRRHAIVTCSDAGCGDFLVRHWLTSLRAHVDLRDIDVVVLDYGLTEPQRSTLLAQGVRCYPAVKDAQVVSARFRDAARFLDEHDYDQVLLVDGGDIIFQADIRPLFDQDREQFRAACEELETGVHDVWMTSDDFSPEVFRHITKAVRGKGTINSGLLLAPARRVREIWQAIEQHCIAFRQKYSDQLAINYLLHTQGYVRLESKYNFAIMAARPGWFVKDGVIHGRDGQVIPVVHNVGGAEGARFVGQFGYGRDRNHPRRWGPMFSRRVWSVVRGWKRWSLAVQASTRFLEM